MSPKAPPAFPAFVAALACAFAASAVISPLKSEMFAAALEALLPAVFASFVVVTALMRPVTTTEPSSG